MCIEFVFPASSVFISSHSMHTLVLMGPSLGVKLTYVNNILQCNVSIPPPHHPPNQPATGIFCVNLHMRTYIYHIWGIFLVYIGPIFSSSLSCLGHILSISRAHIWHIFKTCHIFAIDTLKICTR